MNTSAGCARCGCPFWARLTNGFYYLALGAWFGAMVMLAVGAAVTFKTVRLHQPVLQMAPFDQPEFQGKEAPVLAGAIVGNSLRALKVIQIICAAAAAAGIALQCSIFRKYLAGRPSSFANLLRITLVAIPIVILLVDICWITPSIWEQRQIMWDLSLSAEARQLAQDQFNWFHKLSERIVGLAALSIAAATVASAMVLTGQPKQPATSAGSVCSNPPA